MENPPDPRLAVARLEARVAKLEALLERRSLELRLIQSYVCPRDLAVIDRVLSRRSPLPAGFDPESWSESAELRSAEVAETLEALWRSLHPAPDQRS